MNKARSSLLGLWPVFTNYKIVKTYKIVENQKTKVLRLQPIFRRRKPKKGKREQFDKSLVPTPYSPEARTELLGEIAKLTRDDTEAVLKFAHRYGSLGFYELSRQSDTPYGDPLPWVWLHAETLRLALSLKKHIDDRATEELERLLFEFPQVANRSNELPTPIVTYGCLDKGTRFSSFPTSPTSSPNRAAAIQTIAANILSTIVSANIANLRQELTWETKDRAFRSHLRFTALIEVAYWHLANALQGGLVKRCELSGCGGLFIQTDGRQRFCPTGEKRESPCAVLDRVRRRRTKERRQQLTKKRRQDHGTKR